jgi:hypothetical protein
VSDPESRLELAFKELLGMEPPEEKAPEIGPALVVAVGDLDIGKTFKLLEGSIGQLKASAPARTTKLKVRNQNGKDMAARAARASDRAGAARLRRARTVAYVEGRARVAAAAVGVVARLRGPARHRGDREARARVLRRQPLPL